MSDKLISPRKEIGPVRPHKALAAGESYQEAMSGAYSGKAPPKPAGVGTNPAPKSRK